MDERDEPAVHRRANWHRYRTGWTIVFGVVAAVGLMAAFALLQIGAVLGLFFAVALPVGISVAAWSTVSQVQRDLPVTVALWAGLVAVVTHGLVSLAGPWALLGLVVLGLGSPVLWGGLRGARALRRKPTGSPAEGTDAPLSADLDFDNPRATRLLDPQCPQGKRPEMDTLTISDLSRIWKVSGSWLDRGLNAADTGHLADLRATCLDEIERRDPGGFSRWVEAEHPWVQTHDAGHPEDRDPPPEGAAGH